MELNRDNALKAIEAKLSGDKEKADFWYRRRNDPGGIKTTLYLTDLTDEQKKQRKENVAFLQRMGVRVIQSTLDIQPI